MMMSPSGTEKIVLQQREYVQLRVIPLVNVSDKHITNLYMKWVDFPVESFQSRLLGAFVVVESQFPAEKRSSLSEVMSEEK